jgi:hypothetical protein
MPGLTHLESKRDMKMQWRVLDKIKEDSALHFAEQVRPLRLVVIAASFPYKLQLEEFRAKLGRHTITDVLTETSMETTKDGTPLPSFRFLGVNLQRREVDSEGKPLNDWAPVKVAGNYKPFIVLTGKRFEEDDPKYAPISFPGLVMPKLKQFRKSEVLTPPTTTPMPPGEAAPAKEKDAEDEEDKYPKVEAQLAKLATTLEKLEGKDNTAVATRPSQFSTDDLDVFQPGAGSTATPGGPGGAGADGRPGMVGSGGPPRGGYPGGIRPPTGGRPGVEGAPGGLTGEAAEAPEYCLVRLVDITVQPGKTYEYRLQIRMANPNYGRAKEVASPTYANDRELLSEWSKDPIRVHVKPELVYYAVDQKDLEPRHRGPHYNERVRANQVVLQAHKWIDSIPLATSKNPLLVGEWAVAERMPVYKGEYIGRKERIELPVWRTTLEEFVIATDSTTRVRQVGIAVDFGYPGDRQAILVDAEGGTASYDKVVKRTEDNVVTKPLTDTLAEEVLLLSPDGKLLLREGSQDVDDPDRAQQLRDVRKEVRDVKEKKRSGGSGKPKDPFGGGRE